VCGWCELKDGVLTIVPHPDSGAETRSYRHPDEVTIVGRITAVTMSIEEERFVRLDEDGKKRGKKQRSSGRMAGQANVRDVQQRLRVLGSLPSRGRLQR
jgi:hypothetical protein